MAVDLDWAHYSGHADARSTRHPSDVDIPIAWAKQACCDDNLAMIDPDYNSKSGQSLRLIGWSDTAGFLITVIAVRFEGQLFAASAWKSNSKDHRLYEEGETNEHES